MKLSFKSKRLALHKGYPAMAAEVYRAGLDATLLFTSPLPRNHLARRHSRKRPYLNLPRRSPTPLRPSEANAKPAQFDSASHDH